MWNFVTHASVGVAIATVSAAYYTLVKRDFELETQSMEDVDTRMLHDQGDIGQNSEIDDKDIFKSKLISHAGDEDFNIFRPSQLNLFRKSFTSLELLSKSSGVHEGLNTAQMEESDIDENSPISLKQIVSRSDNLVGSIQSEVETKNPKMSTSIDESNASSSDGSKSVFDVETFSTIETYSEEVLEFRPKKSTTDVTDDNDQIENEIVEDEIEEENTKPKRSTSPVVCYANPRYGQRFACKPENLLPIPDADSQIQKFFELPLIRNCEALVTSVSQEAENTVNKAYEDSTTFLFPPVLSESKISLRENEHSNGDEEHDELIVDSESVNVIDSENFLPQHCDIIARKRKHSESQFNLNTNSSIEYECEPFLSTQNVLTEDKGCEAEIPSEEAFLVPQLDTTISQQQQRGTHWSSRLLKIFISAVFCVILSLAIAFSTVRIVLK